MPPAHAQPPPLSLLTNHSETFVKIDTTSSPQDHSLSWGYTSYKFGQMYNRSITRGSYGVFSLSKILCDLPLCVPPPNKFLHSYFFLMQGYFIVFSNLCTQHGAPTHNLEIKSHVLLPEPARCSHFYLFLI